MSKRKAECEVESDFEDNLSKTQDPHVISRSGRMRKKSSRLIELEEESINEEALNYELTHARASAAGKKSKQSSSGTLKIVLKSPPQLSKSVGSKAASRGKDGGANQPLLGKGRSLGSTPLSSASTPSSLGIELLVDTPRSKKSMQPSASDRRGSAKAVTSTPLAQPAGSKDGGKGGLKLKLVLPPGGSAKKEAAKSKSKLGLTGSDTSSADPSMRGFASAREWPSVGQQRAASMLVSGRGGRKQSDAAGKGTPSMSSSSTSTAMGFRGGESSLEDDDDDEDEEEDTLNQASDGELEIDEDFQNSDDEEDVDGEDVEDEDEGDDEDGGSKDGGGGGGRTGPVGAAATKFFEKQKPKKIKGQKKIKRRRNRAPTAYTVWCNTYRQKIISQNPGIDFASTSKRLGEIWHALPQKEKVQWKKKAKKLAVQGLTSASLEPSRSRPTVNLLATGSKAAHKASSPSERPPQPGAAAALVSKLKRPPGASTFMAVKDSTVLQEAGSPTAMAAMVAAYDSLTESQAKQQPYKVVTSEPLDVAAHLKLLGESLSLIGIRLTNQANIAVQGSLTVLLDSMLCAAGALMCLTQQVPEMDSIEPEVHLNTLDNMAYFMPGI